METTIFIFKAVFAFLVCVLAFYSTYYVKVKTSDKKKEIERRIYSDALSELERIIYTCVTATNQTFCDVKKKAGEWDFKAKKKAYKLTVSNIMNILSTEAYELIYENTGDFELYLRERIESTIKDMNGFR